MPRAARCCSEDGTPTAIDTRLDGGGPVVPRPVQERPGHDRGDLGAGWCGDALGKSRAIAFEGGWLDPAMTAPIRTPRTPGARADRPSGSPVTISLHRVSYSIGADSANTDQGWVLLTLPHRRGRYGRLDRRRRRAAVAQATCPSPEGKDVLVAEARYSRPGGLHARLRCDVQKAFQDEFTKQIQGKTFDAGPVVAATKAAITPPGSSSTRPSGAPRRGPRMGTPTLLYRPRLACQPARRGGGRRRIAGYLFIAVPMMLFLVLQIGTIAYALYISLWDWNVRRGRSSSWGSSNYATRLADPTFQRAHPEHPLLRGGVGAADDGDRPVAGGHRQPEDPRPDVLPGRVLLPGDRQLGGDHRAVDLHRDPDGLFNEARGALGLEPAVRRSSDMGRTRTGSGDQDTALSSVIVLNAWTTSATFMLFYLASLQTISNEVYEAAAIDGAGTWRTFRGITPVAAAGSLLRGDGGAHLGGQLFDQAYIGGGVNGDPNQQP